MGKSLPPLPPPSLQKSMENIIGQIDLVKDPIMYN